jgi:hypothetical protein
MMRNAGYFLGPDYKLPLAAQAKTRLHHKAVKLCLACLLAKLCTHVLKFVITQGSGA